jgi:hypothetical protein
MSRITANGKIRAVAVSRDGRHVAYAAGPIKQQGLWAMQTGTGSGLQIVPPAEGVGYEGLTFSPDGEYVYYVRREGNSGRNSTACRRSAGRRNGCLWT